MTPVSYYSQNFWVFLEAQVAGIQSNYTRRKLGTIGHPLQGMAIVAQMLFVSCWNHSYFATKISLVVNIF
jgi:hypothetical protein